MAKLIYVTNACLLTAYIEGQGVTALLTCLLTPDRPKATSGDRPPLRSAGAFLYGRRPYETMAV